MSIAYLPLAFRFFAVKHGASPDPAVRCRRAATARSASTFAHATKAEGSNK